eukprot:6457604-Prymnesium_polylepis.2
MGRGQLVPARVHSLCASHSCPNVRREAFRPERLDDQMRDSLSSFVDNKAKGMHISRSSNAVTLSSISHWYAGDLKTLVASRAALQ